MGEVDGGVGVVAHHLGLLLELSWEVLGPLEGPDLVLCEALVLQLVVDELLDRDDLPRGVDFLLDFCVLSSARLAADFVEILESQPVVDGPFDLYVGLSEDLVGQVVAGGVEIGVGRSARYNGMQVSLALHGDESLPGEIQADDVTLVQSLA